MATLLEIVGCLQSRVNACGQMVRLRRIRSATCGRLLGTQAESLQAGSNDLDTAWQQATSFADCRRRRQAGVAGHILIEGVAEVPAVGEVQTGRLDQLSLRASALEEHD